MSVITAPLRGPGPSNADSCQSASYNALLKHDPGAQNQSRGSFFVKLRFMHHLKAEFLAMNITNQ